MGIKEITVGDNVFEFISKHYYIAPQSKGIKNKIKRENLGAYLMNSNTKPEEAISSLRGEF